MRQLKFSEYTQENIALLLPQSASRATYVVLSSVSGTAAQQYDVGPSGT